MYPNAAILAAFLLIYSAIAGRVSSSRKSGPVTTRSTIVGGWTVLLSVIAHGVTANRL
jgi:hypothetical protein